MKKIGKDRVLVAKRSHKSNMFRTKLSNCPKVNEIEREKTEKGNNFLEKIKRQRCPKKRGTIRTTLSVVSNPESHCPLAPLSQKFSS